MYKMLQENNTSGSSRIASVMSVERSKGKQKEFDEGKGFSNNILMIQQKVTGQLARGRCQQKDVETMRREIDGSTTRRGSIGRCSRLEGHRCDLNSISVAIGLKPLFALPVHVPFARV